MIDVIAFPRRLHDAAEIAEWALRTEAGALTRRPSLPTARAKSMADQIADMCRALRHEIESNQPPKGAA